MGEEKDFSDTCPIPPKCIVPVLKCEQVIQAVVFSFVQICTETAYLGLRNDTSLQESEKALPESRKTWGEEDR